jgi:hypothetical protein
VGKHPDNYSKSAFPYEVCANVLEISKYGDEFVGIAIHLNIPNISKDCQRIYGDLYSLQSAMVCICFLDLF